MITVKTRSAKDLRDWGDEEPDEDAKKLARIKEEIYYYLGREVSDEEALEVLDFADTKPYTDLSEIVS